MRDIQGKIYENIVSYELFGYKNMKSREYSAIFAYLAPVITDILENIFKYGKDKKIIFIGSNENMIYRLYKRYYDFKDDALITDWSYFMAEYSESREADKFKSYKENLREIYENMPSLRCIRMTEYFILWKVRAEKIWRQTKREIVIPAQKKLVLHMQKNI